MEGTNNPVDLLALLVFVVWTVQAYVPPPTNVTLHCHNFINTLYWNYSHPSLRPSFRADVLSMNVAPTSLSVDAPNHHADVSSFYDPKDTYSLTLTAVVGENESSAAPDPYDGITFSYFKDAPTKVKCSLDFPPVNITAHSDDIVAIRFPHPALLYHHKLPVRHRRQKKHHSTQTRELSEFSYTVTTKHHGQTSASNEHQYHFGCKESVCEQNLPVDGEQQSRCVAIHGHWETVAVRSAEEYCVSAPPDVETTNYIAAYVGVSLITAAALGLISLMLYRKQTSGSSSAPASIKFFEKFMGQTTLTPEQLTPSQVHDTSPTGRPLLHSTEGEEGPHGDTPVEPVLRLPIGVQIQEGDVSGGGMEEQVAEGSEYMSGRGLDGDVEESEGGDYRTSDGYEQREKLVTVVELAPDDRVEGYRG